jgi:AcrR family transcriptional regulator
VATTRVNPVDKHDVRRRALAESALRTLGELGYAKASLREIATNSEFSHGMVHYYFADKLELIVYCVRYYKETCVTRYDGVVSDAQSADELLGAFAAKVCETIVDEAPMHRLWYDLRAQSMFEESLREAVTQIDRTLEDMIWPVVTRYAELDGRSVTVPQHAAYGILDGVFQQALLAYLGSDAPEAALEALRSEVRTLVPLLVG